MKKVSAYQKLKEQNKKLYNDIITLVKNEDFKKVTDINCEYKFIINTENMLWWGNTTALTRQ